MQRLRAKLRALACPLTICKSIHNRDNNASKNMLKIINARKENKKRPARFLPEEEKKEIKSQKRIKKKEIVEV